MLSFGFSRPSIIPPPTKTSKNARYDPFQRKPSPIVLSNRLSPHRVICHARTLKVDASSSEIEVEVHYEMAEEEKEENSTSARMREGLKAELMPKHVAVVIDTDDQRRWAEAKDFPIELGYVSSRRPVERVIRLCCELGIKFLSIHVFSSTESFQRPQEEVDFAMNLIEAAMTTTLEDFMRDGIRVSVIGNKEELPEPVKDSMTLVEETTKDNTKLHLLASINNNGLSSNITHACKILADKVKEGIIQPEDLDETQLGKLFQTNCSDHPDADLLIRASGTSKLANFMASQSAYSEIICVNTFISDFKEADFINVLDGFQRRCERFGGHE